MDVENAPHLCLPEYRALPGGMKELYAALGLLATSENADTVLIRSHIAYWSGDKAAEAAVIKPSRGHSYRINGAVLVRITDYFDHRDGIVGWN